MHIDSTKLHSIVTYIEEIVDICGLCEFPLRPGESKKILCHNKLMRRHKKWKSFNQFLYNFKDGDNRQLGFYQSVTFDIIVG